MKCKNCGNEIKKGQSFCPKCGKRIEEEIVEEKKETKKKEEKVVEQEVVKEEVVEEVKEEEKVVEETPVEVPVNNTVTIPPKKKSNVGLILLLILLPLFLIGGIIVIVLLSVFVFGANKGITGEWKRVIEYNDRTIEYRLNIKKDNTFDYGLYNGNGSQITGTWSYDSDDKKTIAVSWYQGTNTKPSNSHIYLNDDGSLCLDTKECGNTKYYRPKEAEKKKEKVDKNYLNNYNSSYDV